MRQQRHVEHQQAADQRGSGGNRQQDSTCQPCRDELRFESA
jgi:hypothetical protein